MPAGRRRQIETLVAFSVSFAPVSPAAAGHGDGVLRRTREAGSWQGLQIGHDIVWWAGVTAMHIDREEGSTGRGSRTRSLLLRHGGQSD